MDASRKSGDAGLRLNGFAGMVLSVSDPDAAAAFYCGVLGCVDGGSDRLANAGMHRLVATASGAVIALARVMQREDVADSGVHFAFWAGPGAREHIADALKSRAVPVHGYREDRAAEQGDRFYFFDPDGNRLQIAVRPDGPLRGIGGIDHLGVQVPDMMWGEEFYGRVLGLEVESRFGLRTADHARARIWARGEDDMAPGTRRNDKLYMPMGGQNEVPRTNMQVYYRAGDGIVGVYLAARHVQEPPEEELFGSPRMILSVPRATLDDAVERLSVAGRPFLGPVSHEGGLAKASLYFKDTGGNFLELCEMRDKQ